MAEIKPPTGPTSLDPALATEGTESGSPSSRSEGPSFNSMVESAQRGTAPSPTGPVEALVARVRAGELSREEAVDQLIERALADVEAHLTEAQRGELAEAMRSALAHDPTLLALQAELG